MIEPPDPAAPCLNGAITGHLRSTAFPDRQSVQVQVVGAGTLAGDDPRHLLEHDPRHQACDTWRSILNRSLRGTDRIPVANACVRKQDLVPSIRECAIDDTRNCAAVAETVNADRV